MLEGKHNAVITAIRAIPARMINNQKNYAVASKIHEIKGIETAATHTAKTNLIPKAVDRHLGGEYLANKLFSAGEPIVLLTTITPKMTIKRLLLIEAAETSKGTCNNQHTK